VQEQVQVLRMQVLQMQVLEMQVLEMQVLEMQVQVQLRVCWTAPRRSPRRAQQAVPPRAVLPRAARRRARRAECGGGYSMTS
jgi:hypothetical protein